MRQTIVLAFALAGCQSGLTFPDKFVFGVATAGFQNEMGCPAIAETAPDGGADCADPNSDWYQWITTPAITSESTEAIVGGPPSTGPGWFQLYPQDLQLAKTDMHVGAVRMSIEWSRIFPTSTVGVSGYENLKAIASADGIAFYHSVLAQMKQLGLTPLVTVNHYTLPLWIHDGLACNMDVQSCSPSGWLDGTTTVAEIAKFAGFIAQEYGGEVDLWATLNEPLAVPLSGYLAPGPSRSNPPGVQLDATGARTVILNEIEAHAQMYDAIKAADTVDADGDGVAALVGLVDNLSPVIPVDPSSRVDQVAAENTFYLYNEVFLNAVINGQLDTTFSGASTATARPDLARMDYLGINYYNQIEVSGLTESLLPDFSPLLTANLLMGLQLNIYTPGIYEVVQFVEKTYHNIPIYITENGTSQGADDPTAPHDCVQYLEWLQKAIAEGADVRGYFWWTLTDNYEWNHGMTEHFGLYSVDATTKARTIRPLGTTYAQITAARAIPSSLAKEYPIDLPDGGDL